ncbi:hypothetical protein O0I10_002810 [Lichtheimia ornata]|uniref:Uncharacterized protein n=1 Tax=Lichtheimia ornata TaxID=688661 RepID=A0AAD7VAD4_9FUNG|nr:uncharacterized protein O0I10_002810 [Lichtheimia ornata]KAJ8661543.1 hypothetical protein O0I10_002810 [Lichtheimia ornata]
MADTNWCCYCDKAIPTGYSGSLYCSEECLRRDTLEHRRPSADVNALFDPRHYDHKMKQFLFTPQQDNAPSPSSNGDPYDANTTNNSDQEGSTVLARSQSIDNASTTGDSDKVTLVNGDDNDNNS